jgi:hypothetical protein
MPSPSTKIFYPDGKIEATLCFVESSPGVYTPWNGSISVSSSGNALQDGVTSSIKATVINYLGAASTPVTANPLAVILTGTDGAPYNASGGGGGGAVTIAAGADVTEGNTTDVAVNGDNAGTVSAKLRGLNKLFSDVWDSVNHYLKVQIQNTTLAVTQSGSWVISAGTALIGKVGIDQTTPGTTNGVVVNSSALPTGAALDSSLSTINTSIGTTNTEVGATNETAPATDTATSGLNGRLQRVAQRLTSLIALLPTSLGANGGLKIEGVASGTAVPISGSVTANAGTNLNTSALALDATLGTTNTRVGDLTETAPATDTASSGLNGRLQRIAQRLTSLIALLPTALGAGGGLKVDGSGTALPVSGTVTANIGTSGSLALESGGNLATTASTLGATTGAAVTTDANGTIQQYLRGLVKLAITVGSFFTVSLDTTDTIYNGSTALTPKFATITASSSGATTIVALVASKKIRVLSMALTANAAVNAKWQSHTTPTDKTGLFYLGAQGGFVLPYNPKGWFETVAGEALDINLSGAVAVGGMLSYVEV